jgi:polyisoprenoid-binding protein YceI
MTIKSGTHAIGPDNGTLTINTYVGGMGSKMGHDLVLEATRWSGTANVDADNPAASAVQVTVDARSLVVIQASGGLKPLNDKDKEDIAENQAKTLKSDKHPEITFVSTSVSGMAPSVVLMGDLTIAGSTRPISLEVTIEDAGGEARVTGRTTIVQTEFGIKPYSKLGALKVKDPVDMQVTFSLPAV